MTALFGKRCREELRKSSVFWVSVRMISRLSGHQCWMRMNTNRKERGMWRGNSERGRGKWRKGAVAVSPAPPPGRWRSGSLGPWWGRFSAGRARWPASGSPHPDSAPPLSELHRDSEEEHNEFVRFILPLKEWTNKLINKAKEKSILKLKRIYLLMYLFLPKDFISTI